MPHRQNQLSMPATREPASLLSVDRAVFELRRGRVVAVAAAEGARALVMAAEGISPQSLMDLAGMAQSQPVLAITRRRAEVLNVVNRTMGDEQPVLALDIQGLTAEALLCLADPLSEGPAQDFNAADVHDVAHMARTWRPSAWP
ncbi:MAG: hypothetical protein JKY27_05180, partial [Magnetovibrio sp.]|nr:hypothetical protein [Magnetovibrio sp.]